MLIPTSELLPPTYPEPVLTLASAGRIDVIDGSLGLRGDKDRVANENSNGGWRRTMQREISIRNRGDDDASDGEVDGLELMQRGEEELRLRIENERLQMELERVEREIAEVNELIRQEQEQTQSQSQVGQSNRGENRRRGWKRIWIGGKFFRGRKQ